MAERKGRSLAVSPQKLKLVDEALKKFGSQADLAAQLRISRTTVNKFCTCTLVSRAKFHQICKKLELDWREIAGLPKDAELETEEKKQDTNEIDALVQEVRSRIHDKILNDCGKMPLRNQQVTIDNLYTDVYILEDVPKQRFADISQRLRDFDSTADRFENFYLGKVGAQIPGLDVVKDGCKLMCLGAPGSGKTTYLKYVAIQCDQGQLQANQVPIFIRLIEFAYKARNTPELSLIEYINQLFLAEGVEQPQAAQKILQLGRALILLDGLDEVTQTDSNSILSFIRDFCQTYHKNSIIITCRTNALEYSFRSLGFTEIIVADFNQQQIDIFANKWFVAVTKNNREIGEARAKQFIKKLGMTKNQRIRALAVTPILLNLTCLVFNDMGDFPANRATLYKWGLNILLKEWNESNRIELDELYQRLSADDREELLTHVAVVTFKKSRYFFEQDEVERYIADYLRTLPNTQNDRSSLQHNTKALLKSIEAEHGLLVERARGIYSFSHLTFQEYFTAKWFVERTDWKGLMSHISDKGWREVFLLSFEMMKPADSLLLLMKRKIDELVAEDDKLQRFLEWVNKKAKSVEVYYKRAAVRAFYLASLNENFIFLFRDIIHRQYRPGLKCHKSRDFRSDICFTKAGGVIRLFIKVENFIIDFELLSYSQNVEHNIQNILKKLQEQIPNPYNDQERFDQWIKDNSQAWTEQLIKVIVNHPNIAHDWEFSEAQKELLGQYYDTNKLLVDCLNSDCDVSREVRQEIEDTLLLPMAEIEKSQQRIL